MRLPRSSMDVLRTLFNLKWLNPSLCATRRGFGLSEPTFASHFLLRKRLFVHSYGQHAFLTPTRAYQYNLSVHRLSRRGSPDSPPGGRALWILHSYTDWVFPRDRPERF
jgi:hypothetical protein